MVVGEASKSDRPLPKNPAEIRPDFLTPILQAAGVLRRATVVTIQVEPLAAKASFKAQLARLRLGYSTQEVGAPQSLIAKLPTVNTALQQNAAVFRPGAKECWFYRHGVARAPLNVPDCYYNVVDAATGESFLLLEDLAGARSGSWADGVSLDQAELALEALARLHAAWWATEPTAEPELASLLDNAQEAQDLVERLYEQAWPRFLGRDPGELPDDVRQFGERLAGRISAVEASLDHSPRTLVHGDFRLENILFGVRGGKPACWVIDWEDIMLWSGMFDVAWFLGGCLPAAASAEEEGLLRRYHQALARAGVAGYPWSQCYHDYRCAMLSCFVQGILTAAPLEIGDDADRNLTRAIGERFVLAAKRLRLYELLPS